MTFKDAVLLWVLAVLVVAVLHVWQGKQETIPEAEPEPITEPVVVETDDDLPEELVNREAVMFYPVALDHDIQIHIIRTCEEYGVDPAIVIAMIDRESDFRADAVGDNCNSFGLMQIQERWHEERMERLGCDDLMNPYQNVTVGIDYLCELLNRYDGDMEKALVAYNQGSFKGTVTEYAKAVMEKAGELTA